MQTAHDPRPLAQSLYYNPSGALSPVSIILAGLYGVGGGAVLGAVYGYLTQYNPFIYINFLASAGFGFLLGYLGWLAAKQGRTRSPLFAGLLGLITGGLGLYLGWVFWVAALFGRGDETMWFIFPWQLWEVIEVINREGAWNLKGTTPTGIALWLIWGAELVVVMGLAAFTAYSQAADTPFCEKCSAWAIAVFTGRRYGPSQDLDGLRRRLETGDLGVFAKLPAAEGNELTSVDLQACPTCKQRGFLSVEKVVVSTNKKGERKEDKTKLLRHLIMQGASLEAARALGPKA